MPRKADALLVVIVLVFGACGEGGAEDGSTGAPPDTPVSTSPAPHLTGPDEGGAERVEPQPGMDNVRAHAYEKVRILDDRSLRIFFYQGVPPCSVLDRVDVEYGTETVAVTLQIGHEPGAEDTACIEIAIYNYVDVELQEPLDDRRVVDGAS